MTQKLTETSLLVVEDDWDLRDALSTTLELAGFKVFAAESAEQALDMLASERVELVITDVNMSGMDGHALLAHVRHEYPFLPVVIITAFGSIEQSVNAMRNGATDYLLKPFQPEMLIETVRRYLPVSSVSDLAQSEQPVAEAPGSRQLLQLAKRVAAADATVLISGESGTGKEVLARYIHDQSPRAHKAFIAINCAAIPENMLEATLFGHEKGAFTGAYASAAGKFELADGGTILLDEISEMDIGLQAKILRVLQEREVERVGGRKTLKLDVRVIATTNRQLKQCVEDGSFREDLYYRLSVFPLQWQPLRERKPDIVPLAERILAHHAKKMQRGPVSFSAEAVNLLLSYPWPGNVRELDNVIQRALIMEEGNHLQASSLGLPTHFALDIGSTQSLASSISAGSAENDELLAEAGVLGNDLRQREFEIILSTLREQGGRRKETAEVLGVSPRTLRYKIARMKDSGINIDTVLSY
ncbi:MAG: sigma-54 dependent transcriptional regulator [Pseudomonadales bacterium]|nr:sigma-54 dependent transcriptional regulator [Pseudomonadales bacterium]